MKKIIGIHKHTGKVRKAKMHFSLVKLNILRPADIRDWKSGSMLGPMCRKKKKKKRTYMDNVDTVRVVLQNSIFLLLPVLLGRERKPMCAVIQVHSNRKCGTKSLVCTRRILLVGTIVNLDKSPRRTYFEHSLCT